MPDREKVIKETEDGIAFAESRGFGGLANTMRDALAHLKEQEPKQIVRKQCEKEHDDGSIDYFTEWYCPHCKLLILRGFGNPSIKFCYKCGKPILWECR